jgi:6-phosphogluconolactonase
MEVSSGLTKGLKIMASQLVSTRIREEDEGRFHLRVASDVHELADQSAAFFADQAKQAIAERGRFFVLLSGSSTPLPMYERMTRLDLPWDKVHFFWGDERMVPSDDPESNYLGFKKAFLDRLGQTRVPSENVHRVRTEAGTAERVARLYQAEIRNYFGLAPWPHFDFALQGVGLDGHTASLFPDSQTELDPPEWVIAPFVEKLGQFRISVTLGVLNSTRVVMFLVAGENKAKIVRQIIRGPKEHRALLPSQRVAPPHGEVFWFLDSAAASFL